VRPASPCRAARVCGSSGPSTRGRVPAARYRAALPGQSAATWPQRGIPGSLGQAMAKSRPHLPSGCSHRHTTSLIPRLPIRQMLGPVMFSCDGTRQDHDYAA
jgi:hypothetical protein